MILSKPEMIKEIQDYQSSLVKSYKSGVIEPDFCDMVELYHGTTLGHLKDILEKGLVGRNISGNSNYSDIDAESTSDLVYLSNKWHFIYSLNSNNSFMYRTHKVGIYDKEDDEILSVWNKYQDIPIILSVSVPRNCLVIDEDIVYNRKVFHSLLNNELNIKDISIDRALEIGTVGCFYDISVRDINNIFLVDMKNYNSYLKEPYSYYSSNFFDGFETTDLSEFTCDMMVSELACIEYCDFCRTRFDSNDNLIIEIRYIESINADYDCVNYVLSDWIKIN